MISKVLMGAFDTIYSSSYLFDSILMKYRGHSRVLESYDVKAIFKLRGLPHGPPASLGAPNLCHGPQPLHSHPMAPSLSHDPLAPSLPNGPLAPSLPHGPLASSLPVNGPISNLRLSHLD